MHRRTIAIHFDKQSRLLRAFSRIDCVNCFFPEFFVVVSLSVFTVDQRLSGSEQQIMNNSAIEQWWKYGLYELIQWKVERMERNKKSKLEKVN